MRKHGVVISMLALIVVMSLAPVVARASVNGWSEYIVTSTKVGGKATTMDGRPYLAAYVTVYVDGVGVDYHYRDLQPVSEEIDFLVAIADHSERSSFGPGEHELKIDGAHEAAELVGGQDKERSTSSVLTTFTSSVNSTSEALAAVSAKVKAAHANVETAFGLSRDFEYYNYRDYQAIGDGEIPCFGPKQTALSFLWEAMEIQRLYFNPGDFAPGYWISQDGQTAVIGTQKADGSTIAFRLELLSDDQGERWETAEALL